jgi:K+/H+ antiporter YhaU regulatory subunit KhtT
VEFLDRILQDRDGNQLRIEEIPIPEGSSIFGRTLAQTRIRNTGALVLAIHQPDGTYVYNPKGDMIIARGSGIVVLADDGALTVLHEGLEHNTLTHIPG